MKRWSILVALVMLACGEEEKDTSTDTETTDTETTDTETTDTETTETGVSTTETGTSQTGDTSVSPTDTAAETGLTYTDSATTTDTSSTYTYTLTDSGTTTATGLCGDPEYGACPAGSNCQACLGFGDTGGTMLVYTCLPNGAICGRPFTQNAQALLASTEVVEGWQSEELVALSGLSAENRQQLAQLWTELALEEHASIGSFARFTLDLLAVGAPAELLAGAQQAALEEVTHAKDAFALASAFAGRPVGPGAIVLNGQVQLSLDLEQIAVEALLHGACNETVAASVAMSRLNTTTDLAVRRVLERVVDDEGKHAAMAWRTVRWALEQQPNLRAPLTAAFAAWSGSISSDGVVLSHGGLSEDGAKQAVSRAVNDVLLPAAAALGLVGVGHCRKVA